MGFQDIGAALMDQYPNLSDHTHKGIEFLDKYGQFMKERCAIEIEYAGKLKRLAKHHQLKKKDEEDNQYTHCKAFLQMLQEMTDLAGQHEVVAENIMSQIVKEIAMQLKELKEERKKYLQEGQKLQNSYRLSLEQLEKSKKCHEKAFRESEKATEAFQKADADLNLSRAEVEKARQFSTMKQQICDETKIEYAKQLQNTNELQRKHFDELMPKVFQQLQEMEERRIACVQNYMKSSAQIQRQVQPIIDKCLEGIIKSADSISSKGDSIMVIERYKSGMYPPEDIPFDDLTNPSPQMIRDETSSRGSTTLHYKDSIRSETLRGTLSMGKLRKRGGIFGMFAGNKNGTNFDDIKDDYSELPPNQRRKKIRQKIDQIQAQINQEMAVRDGLMKMKAAYEANPNMGDPNSVEGQLKENSHKLDKLQTELRKFVGYQDEMDGLNIPNNTPDAQKKSSSQSSTQNNRNSIHSDQDSLSRSASDSSFCHNNQTQNQQSSKTRDSVTSQNFINHNHNTNNHNTNNHTNHNSHEQITTSNKINPVSPMSPKTNGATENSPESGISTSHLSIPDADYVDAEEDLGQDGDFDPTEALPALGKARALYPFEAQSDGSIGMEEGEELDVVELDQGDGWTRVRRIDGDEEGFVPTSYIEVEIAEC